MKGLKLASASSALAVVGLAGAMALEAAAPAPSLDRDAHDPRFGAAAEEGTTERASAPEDLRVHLLIRKTHEWPQGAASEARFHLRTLQGALDQAPFSVDEVEVGELHLEPVLEEELLPARPRVERETRVVGYRAVIPVTVLSSEASVLGWLVQVAEGAGAELEVATEPRGGGEPDDAPSGGR